MHSMPHNIIDAKQIILNLANYINKLDVDEDVCKPNQPCDDDCINCIINFIGKGGYKHD